MDENENINVNEASVDSTVADPNSESAVKTDEPKIEYKRLDYLDNIKWITVLVVIVYHLFYSFNCSGVINNIGIRGIPVFDAFQCFVYPWMMCLMFVVSGISARYALAQKTSKEFIKDRAKRILLPSIAGIFLLGWITGWVTSQHTDMFSGNGATVPAPIKYLVYCFAGIGPLWYCHVLFLGSLLIVLIKAVDKKKFLEKLGSKVNIFVLLLFLLPVWGSAQILIVPVVSVYRLGIYLFMMLLGYYVFSNKKLIASIAENSIALIIIAAVSGALFVLRYYGANYTSQEVLKDLFTNSYMWVTVIAIMGFASRFLNRKNKFANYMTKNSFNYYVLHYPLLVLIAHFETKLLKIPMAFDYIVIAAVLALILPFAIEIIKRIPVIKALIFGVEKKKTLE